MKVYALYLALFCSCLKTEAYAEAKSDWHLVNHAELSKRLGSNLFSVGNRIEQVKVAVIDSGFGTDAAGKIPEGAFPAPVTLVGQYEADFLKKHNLGDFEEQIPLANAKEQPSAWIHGRLMAQVLFSLAASREGRELRYPQLYLLNGNGYSNFKRAIQYAIDNKIEVILCSQNWESFGNFDGTGPFNISVSKATRAGILWVQAAGNYRGTVYNGKVTIDPKEKAERWLSFKDQRGLRLRTNLTTPAEVEVVLSWNSFGNDEDAGTDKDLDLFLTDADGKILTKLEGKETVEAKSISRQVNRRGELKDGEVRYAYESIEWTLPASAKPYWIQVKAHSNNFTETDRLRVTLKPKTPPREDKATKKLIPSVQLLDATEGGEIMIPADHPEVLTVGVQSAEGSRGPTWDGRNKPDVVFASAMEAYLQDRMQPKIAPLVSDGTSTAAAAVGAYVTLLKAGLRGLSRAQLLKVLETLPRASVPSAPASVPKGFQPLASNEYRRLSADHDLLYRGLYHLNGKKHPVLGRYGQAIVAWMEHDPSNLTPIFDPFRAEKRDPEKFAFFATTRVDRRDGRKKVFGTFLARTAAGGVEGMPPWASERRRVDDFIELRKNTNPGSAGAAPAVWSPIPRERILSVLR